MRTALAISVQMFGFIKIMDSETVGQSLAAYLVSLIAGGMDGK